jgi:flagellar biosynthesis protein FliR
VPDPTPGQDLVSFSAAYVSLFALALVRVLGAISLNPLLGSPRVPLPARLGLGLFLTMVILPPGAAQTVEATVGPLQIAGELLVGLLAGFTVTLMFTAIQFGITFISSNMGFGLGGLTDSIEMGGAGLERFFSMFALLVFVQINGHHLFLSGLHELFTVVPVGEVTLQAATAERLAVLSASLFAAGIKMALPVLAALLLTDLGLAILARVAPQFNLFAIGLPAKMGVGLAALIVMLPVLAPRLAALFRGAPAAMLSLAG